VVENEYLKIENRCILVLNGFGAFMEANNEKRLASSSLKNKLEMLSQMAMSGIRITIEKVMERLNVDEREAIRIIRETFVKSDREAEIR